MQRLEALTKYFSAGTTEADKGLLHKIFVAPEQLPEILATHPGSPRILVGNKGVGKTAILEWIVSASSNQSIPTLFLRPDDLDTSSLVGVTDVATTKRRMYECFLDAIASQIGRNLNGFLTGDAAQLYHQSVMCGDRPPDWMHSLISVLNSIARPASSIDFKGLADDLARNKLPKERLAEVVRNYLLSEESVFLVVIDDTDQIASLDNNQHLNRIWGLLLAVRKLTSDNPNIKCVVSLRTEVWMRLLRNEAGQRDQIDHFRPLALFLRAPDALILTIFQRRLALAAAESGYVGVQPIPETYFFEDEWVTLPTSSDRRSWDRFLLKSARERPRDLIQFVGHLAEAARRRGSERIGDVDAESAMVPYSKERTEDLAIEMGFDCKEFLSVVRSFADVAFELEFEELRRHLRTVPSRFSLSVYGKALTSNRDEDAILLLSILHESGFLNARVRDSTQSKNYRHITFLDDPNFVHHSRWNELQSALWEVHPVFRTYILGVVKEKYFRT